MHRTFDKIGGRVSTAARGCDRIASRWRTA